MHKIHSKHEHFYPTFLDFLLILSKLINGRVHIKPGGVYADFQKINKRAPSFIWTVYLKHHFLMITTIGVKVGFHYYFKINFLPRSTAWLICGWIYFGHALTLWQRDQIKHLRCILLMKQSFNNINLKLWHNTKLQGSPIYFLIRKNKFDAELTYFRVWNRVVFSSNWLRRK